MNSPNKLLKELHRLNRNGVINDEEFTVLRKIIAGGGRLSPEHYRRFDRLFATDPKSIKVESIRKKHHRSSTEKPLEKDERLYSIEEAVNTLNLKLKLADGFDNSRKLQKCPACGMFEAVTPDEP